MHRILSSSIIAAAITISLTGSPAAESRPSGAGMVIAHYPLTEGTADARGLQDPMNLINAPFEGGGVRCNGVYQPLPGGYLVETPPITGLDFASFAISVEFRLETYPVAGPMPIIMGSRPYRWMGAEITADGRVHMRVNNDYTVPCEIASLGEWHEVLMTFDGENDANIYLDGVRGVQITLTLEHGDDRAISTTNFGSAAAFDGWIRNLVVYGSAFDPMPVQANTWGAVKALLR